MNRINFCVVVNHGGGHINCNKMSTIDVPVGSVVEEGYQKAIQGGEKEEEIGEDQPRCCMVNACG